MKKSQSSTEFMIFIGIAIILLLSYFAISYNYLDLIYKQRDIISGQDLAKQIKNEINLASRVEDGYERTFILPNKVGNKDFIITLSEREVTITIDDLDYVELLSTHITNEGETITYSPGEEIIIKKTEGIVCIGECEEPPEEPTLICNEEETKCGTELECGMSECTMICSNNEWIITNFCRDANPPFCENSECVECMEDSKKCGTELECLPSGYPECAYSCILNEWVLEPCIPPTVTCDEMIYTCI